MAMFLLDNVTSKEGILIPVVYTSCFCSPTGTESYAVILFVENLATAEAKGESEIFDLKWL